MATRVDRLERLFSSRRKPSAALPSDGEGTATTAFDDSQPLFPSPSYIRPKAGRMTARDEVLFSTPQVSRRAQSLPDPAVPRRTSSAYTHKHKTSSASTTILRLRDSSSPRAQSIFGGNKRDTLVSGLQRFYFPDPPANPGEQSPTSPASSLTSPKDVSHEQSRRAPSSPGATFGPARSITPPSDRDPSFEEKCAKFRNRPLPSMPPAQQRPPTPGPSPEMAPVTDGTEVVDAAMLDSTSYGTLPGQGDAETATLRRAASHSSFAPSVRLSFSSSTLKEPPVSDFLTLSDDDIAEDRPATPCVRHHAMPPTPAATVSTVSPASSRTASVLTVPPLQPARDVAATAAAHWAARMAGKYNFDMLYVLNLWPETTKSSKQATPKAKGKEAFLQSLDGTAIPGRRGMAGRLLASYGLSNIKSGFQISAAVHAKILRSAGWIEYRGSDESPEEFARGYACSFYTGQYARRASTDSAATAVQERQHVDRGIVFAAYRKGKAGEDVGSSKEELAEIHQSAEALVEILIDLHVTERIHQPVGATHSDVTGPMPVQKPSAFI